MDICINGNGSIIGELGLADKIESFDEVYNVENLIRDAKNDFTQIKNEPPTYTLYNDQLQKRIALKEETLSLVPSDAEIENFESLEELNSVINFKIMLNFMNQNIKNVQSHNNEEWKIESNSNFECKKEGEGINDQPSPPSEPFKVQLCKPFYRNWIFSITKDNTNPISVEEFNNIKGTAKAVTDIIDALEKAKSEDTNSYSSILRDLKNKYVNFLESYEEALGLFNTTIGRITNKIKGFAGEGNGLFDFIKCNFIGTNLKILLKYMKSALGTNIYIVGICLNVVGCSLILSISSTILLIIVINVVIDDNKKKSEKEKIPEYNLNQEGRVIQYQE